MSNQHFIILGRLPGYNELHKSNWQLSRRIKQEAMNQVAAAARWARVRPAARPVKEEIYCFEPNARRDPDNVTSGAQKVILDALQQMGVLAGDGRKYIADIRCPRPAIDRKHPRVEVTIEEVK